MVPKEWISPAAIQHTLDQHKSETNEHCQNGASTTRVLFPDESTSFVNNTVTEAQQQQSTQTRQNKSKTIWPELFTNGQSESSDQNKSV